MYAVDGEKFSAGALDKFRGPGLWVCTRRGDVTDWCADLVVFENGRQH